MKITNITCHVCSAGLRNWVFVRIETDQAGLVGWGEATLEWKTRATVGAVDDIAPLLIGSDPRDIEKCRQTVMRHGFWRMGVIGMTALSGIEIALWDILGKSLGVPVWRLLGGRSRNWLRTYAHLGLGDQSAVYGVTDPTEIAEKARALVEAGYDALKIVATPYTHYLSGSAQLGALDSRMATLREAVGDEVEIMVDFHGRPAGIAAARAYLDVLAPYRPFFAEEPLPPEDMAGHAALTSEGRVPIASGERWIGRQDFARAFASRAVDIAQPDICHVGGLSEARAVAYMAENAGVGLAPHNPLGPIAGLAALHFGIAVPNVIIQEEMTGAVPWYDAVAPWPITRRPGRWDPPELPGLGVEVDLAEVQRHPFKQEEFATKEAIAADGTILDW